MRPSSPRRKAWRRHDLCSKLCLKLANSQSLKLISESLGKFEHVTMVPWCRVALPVSVVGLIVCAAVVDCAEWTFRTPGSLIEFTVAGAVTPGKSQKLWHALDHWSLGLRARIANYFCHIVESCMQWVACCTVHTMQMQRSAALSARRCSAVIRVLGLPPSGQQ
jgi:hypothetical protein